MFPVACTGGELGPIVAGGCLAHRIPPRQSIYQSPLALSQRLKLSPIIDSTVIEESATLQRYCRYKELP
jgi:hypothetical protein